MIPQPTVDLGCLCAMDLDSPRTPLRIQSPPSKAHQDSSHQQKRKAQLEGDESAEGAWTKGREHGWRRHWEDSSWEQGTSGSADPITKSRSNQPTPTCPAQRFLARPNWTLNQNSEPAPSSLSPPIWPPMSSTNWRVMARPSPVPADSR